MMVSRMAMSVEESAQALSLSPWTIRKYIEEGKIKAVKIGRRVLIEPSELQRLIEEGRKKAAAK
jgi:excisionase family DNA binding protein